jgi:hypothetical protein
MHAADQAADERDPFCVQPAGPAHDRPDCPAWFKYYVRAPRGLESSGQVLADHQLWSASILNCAHGVAYRFQDCFDASLARTRHPITPDLSLVRPFEVRPGWFARNVTLRSLYLSGRSSFRYAERRPDLAER